MDICITNGFALISVALAKMVDQSCFRCGGFRDLSSLGASSEKIEVQMTDGDVFYPVDFGVSRMVGIPTSTITIFH